MTARSRRIPPPEASVACQIRRHRGFPASLSSYVMIASVLSTSLIYYVMQGSTKTSKWTSTRSQFPPSPLQPVTVVRGASNRHRQGRIQHHQEPLQTLSSLIPEPPRRSSPTPAARSPLFDEPLCHIPICFLRPRLYHEGVRALSPQISIRRPTPIHLTKEVSTNQSLPRGTSSANAATLPKSQPWQSF